MDELETRQKIDQLRKESERCYAQSFKEWPHHAEHSRKVGRELADEADALERELTAAAVMASYPSPS